jgi:ribose transport system substrate-binding protein
MKRVILALLLLTVAASGCRRDAPPPAAGQALKIVVIGKSVNPYWSNVEKGVEAAGRELGVRTIFYVPPNEDAAAQIETMETYVALGVAGIAIAPSDPQALERSMRRAAAAGIAVIALDTPPAVGSVSAVYIGTDNFAAGRSAGETLAWLLPDGGKVGIGRGSDTALNALQRTEGFLAAVAGTRIQPLPAVNDQADAAAALQTASSVISANPDLAGAFGVYAYNGPAWATAIKEARAVGRIKVVCFDANTDTINAIKEGVIDATVAQREYDMGYKSVQALAALARGATPAALTGLGAVDGFINTGVDVVTAANLREYEAVLDARGIPHEWTTRGWTPPATSGK